MIPECAGSTGPTGGQGVQGIPGVSLLHKQGYVVVRFIGMLSACP